MAIVLRVLILCDTDNYAAARQAVSEALEIDIFTPDSPVLDYAIGIEQVIDLPDNYEGGTFIAQVPAAALLNPANCPSLPI